MRIVADRELGRVLFATEDHSAKTVARFAADLAEHGGDPQRACHVFCVSQR